MTPMEHLAQRVYILRHTKRLSQQELARRVGCSTATISNLETNKLKTITIDHLVALARVLRTSVDDLLGTAGEDSDPAQAVSDKRLGGPGRNSHSPEHTVRSQGSRVKV